VETLPWVLGLGWDAIEWGHYTILGDSIRYLEIPMKWSELDQYGEKTNYVMSVDCIEKADGNFAAGLGSWPGC
jgi:hypothetical protein